MLIDTLAQNLEQIQGSLFPWIGYKLHIDAAYGGIPISCLLTSASMHDSQASYPWQK